MLAFARRMAALALLLFGMLAHAAHAQNRSDIWWNPDESGWGVTIADHESNLFVVIYLYREDGQPVWYTVPGGTLSADRRFFNGEVFHTRAPSYAETPFDPSRVVNRRAGSATIDFAPPGRPAGTALLSYSIDGVSRAKEIRRYAFGSAAATWGKDVTELWYNPAESGWGLALSQQGGNVFGVWYTHGADGEPLWVVMPGVTFTGASSFAGKLYTSTGPSLSAPTFDPAAVRVTEVGEGSFSWTLEKAELGQGLTAVWEPVITRAPFGTVRQRRLTSPLPFGQPNPLNNPQPSPPSAPRTCTGLYSASVRVPDGCVDAGTQRSFSGSIRIGGIDWTKAGQQQGTLGITNFLAAITSTRVLSDGRFSCDQSHFESEDDAAIVVDLARDAAGTMVGTGRLVIEIPWQSEVSLRVPGGLSVNGSFSYRYEDNAVYAGSGTFACQFTP